jgi:CRISPR-associated protein Cmx8
MQAVQATTAEAVPFENRVDTQLLLHFWVLTARIFTPRRLNVEGASDFVGYVLTIPEVGDLERFCRRYKELLSRLDARKDRYRPTGAVVALPEQGPLEFLHSLDRLTAEKVLAEGPSVYVSGIEFYYMVDADKSAKLQAHGRIPVEARLIEEYASIRRDFHNPEIVAGLILALLRGRPWFAEFDATVHEREWSYLVHSSLERRRTPAAMIGFAREVARKFKSLSRDLTPFEEPTMSESDPPPDAIDAIIYDLVRAYVRERACARAGVKTEDEHWWTKTAEERRDVYAKLFLEFRSRHGDEFVSYFTDTIASVAQWLPEDRYLAVSRALMCPHTPDEGPDRPRTRDDIKTLTMLALSAHSRSLRARADDDNGSDDPTHDHPAENAA